LSNISRIINIKNWARTTAFDTILCTVRTVIDFPVLPVTTQLSEVYIKAYWTCWKRLIQQPEQSLLFDSRSHSIFIHSSYLFEMINCWNLRKRSL